MRRVPKLTLTSVHHRGLHYLHRRVYFLELRQLALSKCIGNTFFLPAKYLYGRERTVSMVG
jgi:hypothetical protein